RMPSPTALRCRGRFSVIVPTPSSRSNRSVRKRGRSGLLGTWSTSGRSRSTTLVVMLPHRAPPYRLVGPSIFGVCSLTQAASPQASSLDVWPVEAYALGDTFDGFGTNFPIFSEAAEKIELCLFDADGTETRL